MTPKQKYMERKRLKADRKLHQEAVWAESRNGGQERENLVENQLKCLMDSMERIANVLELWADQQTG